MMLQGNNDGDNPYESPQVDEASIAEAPDPVKQSFRDAKLRVLTWMVVVFAVSGFLTWIISEESGFGRIVDVATMVCFAVLLLQWCSLDRTERQLDPWPYFVLLVVLCPGPLIMMPLYLCRTRGWGGLIATGKAVLFFLLLIGVAVLGTIVGMCVTEGLGLLKNG